MGKTIAILSGKGGTGKTTLAINLAAALHGLGENTILVDANLTQPHVGISLGTGRHLDTLHDVMENRIAPMQAVNYHQTGLLFVPGNLHPSTILDLEKLKAYKPLADVVLFDGPPGDHSHALAAADQVLIITTPHPTALADASRTMNEATRKGKTMVGVVLNRRGRFGLSDEQVERYLSVPTIATIPHDDRIEQATLDRVPYLLRYPDRPAAKAIAELASRISGRPLKES
jgi:septum site-determining protein MinD